MDYMAFVNEHRRTNADITIGTIPYGYDRASEFGLMKVRHNAWSVLHSTSREGFVGWQGWLVGS